MRAERGPPGIGDMKIVFARNFENASIIVWPNWQKSIPIRIGISNTAVHRFDGESSSADGLAASGRFWTGMTGNGPKRAAR